MRAWLCRDFGTIEAIELAEVPRPVLGSSQVRVRIRAVPLGFMDALMIRGLYQLKPDLPYSPGAVGAGEVIEIGDAVRDFRIGDRVSFLNYFGALAEEIVTEERTAVRLPETMSFEDGAALRLSYTPAYLALAWRAKLQKGETLLVTGASGGVGHAAVRLGKVMGARVIGSVGNPRKMELVKEFGADEVIDHSDGRLRDKVKELTGGKGADVTLDLVGGDVFDECLRCIAVLGRIVVMGFTSGRIPTIPANLVLLKNCSIVGVFLGGWSNQDHEGARRLNAEIVALAEQGVIPAYISQRFGFERAREALNALVSRRYAGKIVVAVP